MKSATSLLLVDDDAAFRKVLASELARVGFSVATAASGAEALTSLAQAHPDVVLLDLQLPDMTGLDVLKQIRERDTTCEVIMMTGHGSIDTAIESIRLGAFDYLAKPCPMDELDVCVQRALERQALRRRTSLLERGLTPSDPGNAIVGDSPEFREVMALVDRVAPTSSTVLVSGETGTGKEMIAKLIHARSARRSQPFVVVECATLQESLLQSELFGHERGAFTGAERAKPGLFEVADGGTVLLDEVGEISLATQVMLLRVLDTSTFRRVGSTSEIHVDVRLIVATNRHLETMVRQHLFREDLYYRLATVAIEIPALRDRGADVHRLAEHFVGLLNERFGFEKRLASDTMTRLSEHDWPGNVRELLHVVEAAMVVCPGPEILPEHLPPAVHTSRAAATTRDDPSSLPTLQMLERAHIERVLAATNGHRGRAARVLGISERNLYRKLHEHHLESGPRGGD